ncbi:hypothetical protein BLIG_02002 [Bifidobacterium longum subsp. infantis CCUG 52486]|uniref:Uncharacterized protein n=1 Tax=Bifidobacterium longum subsp. infantis CCUG 52486 TaxID=537937 RepID=C5ECX9_BIFLI|nr:hypothetical protein BLIG_02002 [Bifidobacterium longum subsp. infantis CCUG 52486]
MWITLWITSSEQLARPEPTGNWPMMTALLLSSAAIVSNRCGRAYSHNVMPLLSEQREGAFEYMLPPAERQRQRRVRGCQGSSSTGSVVSRARVASSRYSLRMMSSVT